MDKEQDKQKHDKLIAWAALGFGVTLVLGLSININAQSSQQSGTACVNGTQYCCLLYTSPSPRDGLLSRMPSSA